MNYFNIYGVEMIHINLLKYVLVVASFQPHSSCPLQCNYYYWILIIFSLLSVNGKYQNNVYHDKVKDIFVRITSPALG